MIKRIFTFLLLNFVIVLTVSLLLQLFQVRPYLTAYGIDYPMLLGFCLIWGMTGAVISLLLSRLFAKWFMGVKLISPHTQNHHHRAVYEMVCRLAQKAGLPDVPQVGIFASHQPNAFATGPTKRRSLVAFSTGLLENLSKEELEAVAAHEISHITTGDMVTMTLLQGVVNAFVMFLARVLALILSGASKNRDNNRSSAGSYYIFTFIFEVAFMILGSLIIAYVSRKREFRADRGAALLAGKEPMIQALKKLESFHGRANEAPAGSIATLMIARPRGRKDLLELFASHPPIEERIEKLRVL